MRRFFHAKPLDPPTEKQEDMDDVWMTIECEGAVGASPTPMNTPVPSPKQQVVEVKVVDCETKSMAAQFQEESIDVQQKYFSGIFLDVLPLEDSRELAGSIVNVCRSSLVHPEFVLRLMIAVKDLRVPGLTKRNMVKKVYLEFFEESDWAAKGYDEWIDQLVMQLPGTFRPRRCCCFAGLFL
jgi:hypothetical protein